MRTLKPIHMIALLIIAVTAWMLFQVKTVTERRVANGEHSIYGSGVRNTLKVADGQPGPAKFR